jgi:transglutaminase-like putative cysteine protease
VVVGRELDEAADGCRATGLAGWALVDHATRVVCEQFSTYSVLHPWESPSGAFRHRRGYCTQYNGALASILQELDVEAWLVYAPRVRFAEQPDWALGHTWVRVRAGGEVRDVCARSLGNTSGHVGFEPKGRVRRLGTTMRLLTTIGSSGTAATAIVLARLQRRPRPDWVEHPRSASDTT